MSYQPDPVTLTQGESSDYPAHPEGQYPITCVDVIELGWRVDEWQGEQKLSPKIGLVFASEAIGPAGEPLTVHMEFTASLAERASLRKFLEDWRGKSYQAAEIAKGVPVHKMCGTSGLGTVEQKVSRKGRTYAKVRSISPLPKGLNPPTLDGYERAPFYADRIKEYAAAADEFRGRQAGPRPITEPPFDAVEDDLPF